MDLLIKTGDLVEIEVAERSHIFVEKKGHHSAFLYQEDCPDVSALVEEILLKTAQLHDAITEHINGLEHTHAQTAWDGFPSTSSPL